MRLLKRIGAIIGSAAVLLAYASMSAAQTCSPVGYWTSTNVYGTTTYYYPEAGHLVGTFMTIAPDMTGTLTSTASCQSPTYNITVTGLGPYHVNATYPVSSSSCPDGAFDFSFSSDCNHMSGTWDYYMGGYTSSGWTRNSMSLQRLTTKSAQASAIPLAGDLTTGPAPGIFAFNVTTLAGPNAPTVSPASGMTTTSNPITFNFVALGPMRTPTPGGQSQLVQTYTLSYPFNVTTTMKSNPNNIAAFGMSCYMIALESDYGTPPNSCSSTRINGVRYSGSSPIRMA